VGPLGGLPVKRLAAALSSIVAVALAIAPAAAAEIQLTPVQRLSFPDRAYVVDLGRDADLTRGALRVWENGAPVQRFSLKPLATTSIHSGVVLAIDASDSMAGRPYENAISGARAFIDSRTGAERIGVLAFNGRIRVVQALTASPNELHGALDHPPALAHGTHIYDSLTGALALLKRSGVSTGAVVLLSDGADLGSASTLEDAVAAARTAHVRIFTVGLVTKSYDGAPLQALASQTGGSYYEALSAVELTPIYAALGQRLASQYLLGYRSKALPGSDVTLRLSIDGVGSTTADYAAPRRAGLAPFHRSFLKRFLLSPAASVALSLLVAAVVAGLLALLLTRARSGAVGRIEEFLRGVRAPADQLKSRGRDMRAALGSSPRAQGWMAKVERDLEIAGIETPARRVVLLTAAATLLTSIVLALVSPVLLLLGLLTPLAVRGWVKRKLRTVRNDFADQLPANLQVLASALRSGHSLSGALAVMVDNAEEPSQRELRRVLADDQLGLPVDEAIRHVADRMANRDLQQVALLSELQRTAGGNAAEVLDTVVETIRERADIRRLLRTLTAQGRMARWILTAIPVVVAAFLTLIQPDIMRPLYTTTGGHVALLVATVMVVAGSLVIQRIVDIEV
jgi:tight adherence protein B